MASPELVVLEGIKRSGLGWHRDGLLRGLTLRRNGHSKSTCVVEVADASLVAVSMACDGARWFG